MQKNGRSEDYELVQRVAQGDKQAMKTLYELYSGPAFHFVRNWLADPHEASDIVHETMLEVWRRAGRFEGRSAVKSWIFSIARNKSIDRNRKGARTIYTDIDPDIVDDTPDPEELMAASQNSEALRGCIQALSETHRTVIHLAFFQDMPYQQIAEIEDCPVGTVKTRILHAKKLLMRCITLKAKRLKSDVS